MCTQTKIVKISMTSPIVINEPIRCRALLGGETNDSFVRWLANLNIKRNLMSMFVSKYLPYKYVVGQNEIQV